MKLENKTHHLSVNAKHRLMRLASYCSVLTALILIVIKIVSFFMTHSLALLSSLMDSGLDLGASVVSLIAIHQALLPADKEHRFGHGKAEALGALAQGIIICFSGIFLLYETIQQLFNPKPLEHFEIGLGVMFISIFVTFMLVSFQRYVVKKTNSLAITADNAHYMGDVLMNIGVIISMFFSYLVGWKWIDPLFAICISFYLFYCSYKIIYKVQCILMDKELPPEIRKKIKETVTKHYLVSHIKDLRTRNSGLNCFVQFSIVLNGQNSLETTHALCDELEKEVKQIVPNCEIFIHPEPTVSEKEKENGR